jgi:hypothetical protein
VASLVLVLKYLSDGLKDDLHQNRNHHQRNFEYPEFHHDGFSKKPEKQEVFLLNLGINMVSIQEGMVFLGLLLVSRLTQLETRLLLSDTQDRR